MGLTIAVTERSKSMSEYIKREDAEQAIRIALRPLELLLPTVIHTENIAEYIMKDVPSADVVEVVRCKDCKWWNGDECTGRDIFVVDDDEYCSYGERRDAD